MLSKFVAYSAFLSILNLMKTIKILKSIALLTILTFLASCKNDDDAANNRINQVTINTQNFTITEAVMFNDGTFNGVTEFELYFTGSGLAIDNNENFTGSGDLLSLRLFSGEASGLEAGEYVYNDHNSNSFLLNRGFHFFGYDASQGDNRSGDVDIESGNVSVLVENNEYIITINLVDENNDKVTGSYKGIINSVD